MSCCQCFSTSANKKKKKQAKKDELVPRDTYRNIEELHLETYMSDFDDLKNAGAKQPA
jgi:hypothetical protein